MPPDDILQAVRDGLASSFCLFGYNVESNDQLAQLTDALHKAAREGNQPPPLIGIDQEGGQLMAVTDGATELPGNMALGATKSAELAEKAGYVLARELLALGINLNFAPSVDINNNPDNIAIGVRSFGDDPHEVARLGVAIIKGMQAQGVIATAKHFPGHGDTSQDSHYTAPTIPHNIAYMESNELIPFREAIDAGVKAVMSAHILFPALDAEYPATLSDHILNGLLRRNLGFDGIIITDAMDMHAVARLGHQESVELALRAGIDLVLLGHIPDQLELTQKLTYRMDTVTHARIQNLRASLPTEPPSRDVIGCAEHQAIAQEIADKSITLVRDTAQQLPLKPATDDTIVVITPEPTNFTPADTSSGVQIGLADAIRQRHANTHSFELSAKATQNDIDGLLQQSADADTVVVGTILADKQEMQALLVNRLLEAGKNPVVIAMRTPYDLVAFPSVETYLCTYSIRPASMEATARVLFGEIEAVGVLPCAVRGA